MHSRGDPFPREINQCSFISNQSIINFGSLMYLFILSYAETSLFFHFLLNLYLVIKN